MIKNIMLGFVGFVIFGTVIWAMIPDYSRRGKVVKVGGINVVILKEQKSFLPRRTARVLSIDAMGRFYVCRFE